MEKEFEVAHTKRRRRGRDELDRRVEATLTAREPAARNHALLARAYERHLQQHAALIEAIAKIDAVLAQKGGE